MMQYHPCLIRVFIYSCIKSELQGDFHTFSLYIPFNNHVIIIIAQQSLERDKEIRTVCFSPDIKFSVINVLCAHKIVISFVMIDITPVSFTDFPDKYFR